MQLIGSKRREIYPIFCSHRRTVLAAILLVFSVGANTSLAQEHFLSEVVFVPGAKFPENKGEANPRHFTFLGLTLNKHTAKEATEKLGEAQILHLGHHAYPLLCYRAAKQGDDTVLTISVDDMGSKQELTGFQLISGSEKFKLRQKCTRNALVSQDLAVESGIKLGLTPEQFKNIWSVQVTEEQNHLVIEFDAYREDVIAGKPQCNDIFSYAVARFANSKLTWLDVGTGGEFIRLGHCTEDELAGRHP